MALPELHLEKIGDGTVRIVLKGEWKLANSLPPPQALDDMLSAAPEITRLAFRDERA